MQTIIQSVKQIGLFTTALTLALVANFAYGQWADPTDTPPGTNINTPIHTGGIAQDKGGDIGARELMALIKVRSFEYCDLTGLVCLSEADLQELKDLLAGGEGDTSGGPITTIRQLNGLQGAERTSYGTDVGGDQNMWVTRIVVPAGITHAIVSEPWGGNQRVFAVTAGDVIEGSSQFTSAGFSTVGKWSYAVHRTGGSLSSSGSVNGLNIIPASGTITTAANSSSRSTSDGDRSQAVLYWAQP